MVWFRIAATIAIAIVYFFATLAKLLREDHPEAFRELGEPSLVPKYLAAANWGFFKFLWFGHFRRLGDKRVNRLCLLLLIHQIVFVAWVFRPLVL